MAIDLTKTEEQITSEMMKKVSLKKDQANLEKHVVSLSKTLINLSKEKDIDLGSAVARVVVVLDYSLSMKENYSDGTVQKTLNRLVPIGLKFDDNGELEVYTFQSGNNFEYRQVLTMGNYEKYVKEVIRPNTNEMGGTDYAPVLNSILSTMCKRDSKTKSDKSHGFMSMLFGKKDTPKEETVNTEVNENTPVFVMFITDGDNCDKRETDSVIKESSKYKMFVQFVGIGDDTNFEYLRKLDDLSGRECDNTGFIQMKDMTKVSDTELYTKLLDQYADWLKTQKLV